MMFTLVRFILLKKWVRSDHVLLHRLLKRFGSHLALALDRFALARSQFWPRNQIQDLQVIRMREMLQAAAHIPLWRERFKKTRFNPAQFTNLAQLTLLPLNTKRDFTMRHMPEFTASKWLGTLLRNSTSGSTGAPLHFYQDGRYELRQYGICDRMLRTATHGRSVSPLAIRSRVRAGFSLAEDHFFFVQSYNSIRHRFTQLIEQIRTRRGDVILYGFSSAMLELARECKRQRVPIQCAGVVTSGEALQESQREEIRKALGAEVFLCYTTSELGWLGFECEHHRIHLNEETAYVEITDENGRSIPSGTEGRIVVTTFDTRVMPFIRYDTGDRGVIRDEQCPCGRTLRTIEVWGRHIEYLSFVDNRTVSLLDVSAAFDFYAHAVQQFQIVQIGENAIRIKIIPRAHFESAQNRLAQALRDLIHPALSIEWELTETIPEGPNGKAVYFVRHL